jgi:hypothetical protein
VAQRVHSHAAKRVSAHRLGLVAAALTAAAAAGPAETASGQPPSQTTAVAARRVEARTGLAARAAGALILGTAWAPGNTPIPAARVRLRRLPTGLIVARTEATERGEFTFGPVEPGTYVVELVDERDRVLAIGQVFSIEAGETLAVFVRLAARGPWLTGLFRNAAAAASAAAAGLGVTAVAPPAQAASPLR